MDLTVELVKLVSRSFYDAKYCVFLDCLLRERVLPDDVLADRLHMMIKDVSKTAAKLRGDHLIKTIIRQEVRNYDERTITRAYHYVDFALFADVVKYRLHRMRNLLEEKTREEAINHGYHCPQCKRQYGPLDAASLINPITSLFECEVCKTEVVAMESAFKGDTLRLQSRLVEQTNGILRILRKLEDVNIPSFDPESYLKDREAFELVENSDDELSVISSRSSSKESVISTSFKDELGKVSSLNKSAELLEIELAPSSSVKAATSPSYSLPEWHTRSTITGEAFKSTVPASKSISSSNLSTIPSQEKETSAMANDFATNYYASLPQLTEESSQRKRSKALEKDEERKANLVLINVAGQPKDIRKVTDEDKDLMTEEEYQKYYEAYTSLEDAK